MLQFLKIGKAILMTFPFNVSKSTFRSLSFYYIEFNFIFQLLMSRDGADIEGVSTLMVTSCRDL